MTYSLKYPNGAPIKKFFCKGEDPSTCQELTNSMKHRNYINKFSMKDDKKTENITITVREVTTADTGTYWCGARRSDSKSSNPFFHRLFMAVGKCSNQN